MPGYGYVKVEGGPTAHKVTVTEAETGKAIPGITGVDIAVRANEPNTVTMRLAFADMSIQGKPRFSIADPRTGKMREIKKIIFADGDDLSLPTD